MPRQQDAQFVDTRDDFVHEQSLPRLLRPLLAGQFVDR